jgi:hypothetical protein
MNKDEENTYGMETVGTALFAVRGGEWYGLISY